jgi:hypothetical protein
VGLKQFEDNMAKTQDYNNIAAWASQRIYSLKPYRIVEQADIGQWWVYQGQKLCKTGLKSPELAAAWCDAHHKDCNDKSLYVDNWQPN